SASMRDRGRRAAPGGRRRGGPARPSPDRRLRLRARLRMRLRARPPGGRRPVPVPTAGAQRGSPALRAAAVEAAPGPAGSGGRRARRGMMEGRAAGAARGRSGTTPLVGRREALREIGRVLDAAERGHGFLALVGEPGAGKTVLLNELADAATTRKLPFVAGRAAEFEQEMPFVDVVDALDDLLEERSLDLPEGALRLLGT